MKIWEIDKNFKLPGLEEDLKADIYNIKENQFCLLGLIADSVFRRMPEDIAVKTNEGVKELHTHTAGGRLRFITDSEFVSLKAVYPYITDFYHMPRTGSSGFDIYVNGIYYGIIASDSTVLENEFGGTRHLGEGVKEIIINFPLYNPVSELFLGLAEGAVFKKAPEFEIEKPIVFYGSSITQGGCVSRPGLSYPAHISRKLNLDYINLGFSGSCKAEEVMGEYLSELPMSVFVYDYDHNTPDIEHLKNTHERLFKQIREKNPTLPIIIISMPDIKFWNQFNDIAIKRRDIIKKTYENAVNSGDKNVYFIDGETLWGEIDWDSCTMDRCHPNDIGHYRMAEKIAPIIKKALK